MAPGNEISDSDGGLVAGRIGTHLGTIFRIGASFLDGEQRKPTIIKKERYGIDLSAAIVPGLDIAVDASRGFDEQTRVSHRLWQLRWTSSMHDWLIYLQFRESESTLEHVVHEGATASAGVRFEPNPHWSISAQWDRDLTALGAPQRGDQIIAQVRYRL